MRKFLSIVGLWLCCTMLFSQSTSPAWRAVNSLPLALRGHSATMLHTGEVLVCGGFSASTSTTSSFIFNAETGVWNATENQLQFPRAFHSLVVVPVANQSVVFAIGGYSGTEQQASSVATFEVLRYNATTKTWRWFFGGSLPITLADARAVYDDKQFIIVSGGRAQNASAFRTGAMQAQTFRINIQTLAVETMSAMATARAEHTLARTIDANGNTLVVTSSGEVSKPVTSTELLQGTSWDARANPPQVYRSLHVGFGDVSKIARMFGGVDATGAAINTCEWYDVKSGWKFAPRMNTPRSAFSTSLIAGTKDTALAYLVCGGASTNSFTNECEIFTLPTSTDVNGSWSPFAPLTIAAKERQVAMTSINLPVVIGGATSQSLSSVEMYQPLQALDADFGQEEIGRESPRKQIRIQNTWLLPVMIRNIKISGSAEFRLTNSQDSLVIGKEGVVLVDVRYRPNTVGKTSAYLHFDIGCLHDSVKLQGEGIKSSIEIATNTVDYDTVRVLQRKRLCFDAIKNTGTDTTVVDSIVVDSLESASFVVVSPIGRTKVAPNQTLQVCIEFIPNTQKQFVTAASVAIGDRRFPVTLTGSGIRARITVDSPPCDTLALAKGDSLKLTLAVRNNSQARVQVTQAQITTSLPGTYKINDASQFPFSLNPSEIKLVEVVFTAQREAAETATITFVNDGDTLCVARLCIVPRSRQISFPVGVLSLSLCQGDSTTQTVLLENPSSVESLRVSDIQLSNINGVVQGSKSFLLSPRRSQEITVQLTPTQAGIIQAELQVTTDKGVSILPISAQVSSQTSFSTVPTTASLAQRVRLPIRLERTSQFSTQQARVLLKYDNTLLQPIQLVASNNADIIVNASSLSIQQTRGSAELSIQTNTQQVQAGELLAVECEILLGESLYTEVTLLSADSTLPCISPTSARINVQDFCGGLNGLIRGGATAQLLVAPNPSSGEFTIQYVQPRNGNCSVQVFNTLGELVASQTAPNQQRGKHLFTPDTSTLSNGVYRCVLYIDGEALLSTSTILQR